MVNIMKNQIIILLVLFVFISGSKCDRSAFNYQSADDEHYALYTVNLAEVAEKSSKSKAGAHAFSKEKNEDKRFPAYVRVMSGASKRKSRNTTYKSTLFNTNLNSDKCRPLGTVGAIGAEAQEIMDDLVNSKTPNNIVLVGQPGMDTDARILTIADRLAVKCEGTPDALKNRSIIAIDVAKLRKEKTTDPLALVKATLDRFSQKNVIFYISNADTLLSEAQKEKDPLKAHPFLELFLNYKADVIIAASSEEYRKLFSYPTVQSKVSVVELHDLTVQELKSYLTAVAKAETMSSGVSVSAIEIENIARLTKAFAPGMKIDSRLGVLEMSMHVLTRAVEIAKKGNYSSVSSELVYSAVALHTGFTKLLVTSSEVAKRELSNDDINMYVDVAPKYFVDAEVRKHFAEAIKLALQKEFDDIKAISGDVRKALAKLSGADAKTIADGITNLDRRLDSVQTTVNIDNIKLKRHILPGLEKIEKSLTSVLISIKGGNVKLDGPIRDGLNKLADALVVTEEILKAENTYLTNKIEPRLFDLDDHLTSVYEEVVSANSRMTVFVEEMKKINQRLDEVSSYAKNNNSKLLLSILPALGKTKTYLEDMLKAVDSGNAKLVGPIKQGLSAFADGLVLMEAALKAGNEYLARDIVAKLNVLGAHLFALKNKIDDKQDYVREDINSAIGKLAEDLAGTKNRFEAGGDVYNSTVKLHATISNHVDGLAILNTTVADATSFLQNTIAGVNATAFDQATTVGSVNLLLQNTTASLNNTANAQAQDAVGITSLMQNTTASVNATAFEQATTVSGVNLLLQNTATSLNNTANAQAQDAVVITSLIQNTTAGVNATANDQATTVGSVNLLLQNTTASLNNTANAQAQDAVGITSLMQNTTDVVKTAAIDQATTVSVVNLLLQNTTASLNNTANAQAQDAVGITSLMQNTTASVNATAFEQATTVSGVNLLLQNTATSLNNTANAQATTLFDVGSLMQNTTAGVNATAFDQATTVGIVNLLLQNTATSLNNTANAQAQDAVVITSLIQNTTAGVKTAAQTFVTNLNETLAVAKINITSIFDGFVGNLTTKIANATENFGYQAGNISLANANEIQKINETMHNGLTSLKAVAAKMAASTQGGNFNMPQRRVEMDTSTIPDDAKLILGEDFFRMLDEGGLENEEFLGYRKIPCQKDWVEYANTEEGQKNFSDNKMASICERMENDPNPYCLIPLTSAARAGILAETRTKMGNKVKVSVTSKQFANANGEVLFVSCHPIQHW